MRIVLVGLKLSIGNQLMMETVGKSFRDLGHSVVGVGDTAYPLSGSFPFHAVTDGRSYRTMLLQTLDIRLWRRIARLVQSESPDLCYFISSHSLNAPVLTLLWQTRQRPLLVSHVHDPIPHGGSPEVLIAGSQWLQVRFSDRVAVFGERLKAMCAAQNRYPPERIVVVRHGTYRPVREAEPAPLDPEWFSLLGRVEVYKGIDVFLDAARIVLQSRPDARFFIGGAGSLAPYETAIRQLGPSVVIQNRSLTNDEMDSIMRRSWAVVLPYHDGTQSGVIPIAYYNACPVIVSNVGSLPELVTSDTGLVIPPRSAASLANAMLEYMNADRRYRAGHAAFRFYKEYLIWDTIAIRFLQCLFNSASTVDGIR